MSARPILDATTYHDDRSARPDSPRFRRVEQLASELRRELELGVLMGEIEPILAFDFIVLRANDMPALKGTFRLAPFKLPEGKAA